MASTAYAERDYVKDMIRQAMTAPLLEPEEEYGYAVRWRDKKCEKSLAKLTEAHMRMAVSTAIKFRGYGLPLADLIQEGGIGLLEAAKRFDPDREVRFCTYAGWWIRASMQDYVLRNWSIVRIGSKSAHKTIFFNLSRIRSMIEEVDRGNGNGETRETIARRFKVTEDDLDFMTGRLRNKDMSLNATFNEEGDTERQDLIPDERDLPEDVASSSIDEKRRSEWLRSAMDQLSAREKTIINERFFNSDKVTLSQLGVDLGLSKERVRQIEKQAIGKLRNTLTSEGHAAYIGLENA
ncbi:RNA polymerase factor sigma-32 [Aquisalinus flavus]|uniref:RNA polymerase sigma factor n=1 Tax=Aquisalinus flavus TaxID=1526572 RepID=A0A8J2V4N4_9PROT|nr:RNA polymerase factor sigma-32 [Aquisalinus flavus]MBD0426078.1 RNA polymerase factor sigma-32 [Aquisalinus flavus]UNE48337.1 RNA polymerase factor sigma-32 [Aquisalinus flavus]GGD10847.1 RNA polymerase factor sigma-32 [Aquisalinus flavus]